MKHQYMFPVTISKIVDESFKQFFGDIDRKVIYNGINISRYLYDSHAQKNIPLFRLEVSMILKIISL